MEIYVGNIMIGNVFAPALVKQKLKPVQIMSFL